MHYILSLVPFKVAYHKKCTEIFEKLEKELGGINQPTPQVSVNATNKKKEYV